MDKYYVLRSVKSNIYSRDYKSIPAQRDVQKTVGRQEQRLGHKVRETLFLVGDS